MKTYKLFDFEKVTYDEGEKRFIYVFNLNTDEFYKEFGDDINLNKYRATFCNLFGWKHNMLDETFNEFGDYKISHHIFENLYLTDNYKFVIKLYEHENEDDYKEILDIAIRIAVKEHKLYIELEKRAEEKNKKEEERIAKKIEEITKRNKS